MKYSTSNPIEHLSEAEFKEVFEHIVEVKQYLLDMHEKIVDVQRASVEMNSRFDELNWMLPYVFEDDNLDDIVGYRRAMYQVEDCVARLLCRVALNEKACQKVVKNRGDKKKEEQEG